MGMGEEVSEVSTEGEEAMNKVEHSDDCALGLGGSCDCFDYDLDRVLQNLQDRAAKSGLPDKMGMSAFTDYIRALYPEMYTIPDWKKKRIKEADWDSGFKAGQQFVREEGWNEALDALEAAKPKPHPSINRIKNPEYLGGWHDCDNGYDEAIELLKHPQGGQSHPTEGEEGYHLRNFLSNLFVRFTSKTLPSNLLLDCYETGKRIGREQERIEWEKKMIKKSKNGTRKA